MDDVCAKTRGGYDSGRDSCLLNLVRLLGFVLANYIR